MKISKATALLFLSLKTALASTTGAEEASYNISHPTVALRGTPYTISDPNEAKKRLAIEFLSQIHSSTSTFQTSSCSTIKKEDQCKTSKDENGIPCVWCKCAAVPSECLNLDQSKNVPPGVFQCEETAVDTIAVKEKKNGEIKINNDESYATNDINRQSNNDPEHMHLLSDAPVESSLCDPNSKSLSGYMDIAGSKYDANGEDKHLFYWFFEKRSKSLLPEYEDIGMNTDLTGDDIPLIVWLTGGPGCSSTLALLTENGPCSVTSDGMNTEVNPYSWTEAAHMLWLDQPAGVGYSYGKETDSNEEMISEDAYYFLQAFFEKHPKYSTNPLFVIGESYGGHYAPAIAHKIYKKNLEASRNGMMKINLAGLAVGNGLTNPMEQYKWYAEMAYNNSHGLKVVSESAYNEMKSAIPRCITLIEQCNKGDSFINSFACQSAFILCNAAETSPYQMTGLNPYDIRKKCGSHPLCYDFGNVETFLNLDSTKDALHISKESHHWKSCNMGINLKFHTDWMKDFSPYVADLLNAGIPSLIYAGDVDFICNYLGNKAWTLNLEWKHKSDFNGAEEHEWDGSGLARSANGLTFLQVYDAGHMVPSDQPKVALSMIHKFISGESF
mmetsp:Transcript_6967/g.9998  ORF Transcript_6967/g.9998 Transcript_6967/m.9998 type:complete len:613 (+) Transcript_6967:34-1872(+)